MSESWTMLWEYFSRYSRNTRRYLWIYRRTCTTELYRERCTLFSPYASITRVEVIRMLAYAFRLQAGTIAH